MDGGEVLIKYFQSWDDFFSFMGLLCGDFLGVVVSVLGVGFDGLVAC